ncbi:MAG: hypothetical protein COT90_02260 [Candidatus Diapherotrites archaeon CG10_big_fil_rev_8_21_14_0_10_31_34]|nr:MAG: hypothetical protein COT90_02260 [Candidatus Diapherotrites archaeon CG10_big_fil_rev_8_21_14_0_10_31_34]
MQEKENKNKSIKVSLDMNKIEEMIDSLMGSMMEKVPDEKQPFVMGFTINFNSDELPLIEELKEFKQGNDLEKNFVAKNFSKPLAEAQYFDKEVIVSFELPKKVIKKELRVDVKEDSVFVIAPKYNFFRRLHLKQKINPNSFSSNFNNSFLELTFKKK